MTFTNAAAAEMKERIGTELEERLEKDPDNLYTKTNKKDPAGGYFNNTQFL